MIEEEINNKIKELRNASKAIQEANAFTKWVLRAQMTVFFGMIYFITSALVYPWGGIGYFMSGVLTIMIPGLIKVMVNGEKDIKKNNKHIENAEFLESYWKGELMEQGYDWRK
jgi:hypothetical protein